MVTKPRKSLVLPERPKGFICHRAGEENLPPELVATEIPEEAQFLAGVFWSWSPAHCLVDRFFLSSNEQGSHWLLWLQWANADWEWKTELYAFGPKRDVPPETAALYLLVDAFTYDNRKERLTNAFHEIDEVGLLKVPQLEAIARIAWPDDERYQEPEPEMVPVPEAKTTRKNGELIRKGKRLFAVEALPTDPIYTRSVQVGGFIKTDSFTHNQPTLKERGFTIRELPPDDPIYTQGFQVGGWITSDSFPNTKRWEDMTEAERQVYADRGHQQVMETLHRELLELFPHHVRKETSSSDDE